MKIKKIDTHKLLSAFDKLGVRYFNYGTLTKRDSNGRKSHTHDFYATDNLTDSQKDALKALFPSLEFFISQSQYAPELKRGIIASPKAARLRELNAAFTSQKI